MNQYVARLDSLRALMAENGIDFYVIPTADFHNSEYVHDYFKCREFMSGFTGSNGTLVVSKTEARLWTDGRYFIQCEKEIAGSTIQMMKMAEAKVNTVVDVTDHGSKIQCSKEQYCIGTWNIRPMNQGKNGQTGDNKSEHQHFRNQ